MSCDYLENVSRLMDNELPAEEAKQMKSHLFACAVCRQAHQDFVRLREQLQTYEADIGEFAKQRALRDILAAKPTPFWQRRIALPAPVFGLLLAIVVVLAALMLSARVRQTTPPAQQSGKQGEAPDREQVAHRGIDFSRYDTGERAVMYKTRRAE